MNLAQYEGLASALMGLIGTVILFRSSYSLEPFEGMVWGGPEVTEHNRAVRVKNAKRSTWQRVGLGFLCLSFFIQALSYY